MMVFIIIIHGVICVGLIGIVLIQRGRGSGLVESFSGVESMFGTKTNSFFTRTTTVLAVLFFFTCLSLAILSVRQSKSLLRNIKTEEPAQAAVPLTKEQARQLMDKAKPSTEEKATPQPQAPAPEKDETKNPQATQK